MSKLLKCADVAPGCNAEIRGESEHDCSVQSAEHAKTDHNMESIPPDMLSKIKGAIHDEGEAEVTKSWHVELIFLRQTGECVAVSFGGSPYA